jgi:hypothetical protein
MVAAALLADFITCGGNAWGLAAEPSAAAEQRTVRSAP